MLTSCINEIHPHCLGFITNYWAFFAMPHVETMPVRLYSADLVSATKQLVECHEMRYRNSLQKTVKCEFRENQRCDGHTLPKGVNEIMYFLSFSSCLDIIWQGRCPQKLTRWLTSESKECLGKVFVLRRGKHQAHSCYYLIHVGQSLEANDSEHSCGLDSYGTVRNWLHAVTLLQ